MEKLKRKKQSRECPYIIMGILLIVISSFISINNKLIQDRENNITKKSIESFIKKMDSQPNVIEIKKDDEKEIINYVALIEIPKINLKRGLLDINDVKNDIKYNIQILKESNFPDEKYGNFILASHSGNSSVSFFRNLNKLDNDDEILIYYKNKIFTYKVYKIYEIEKNGKAIFELDNINTFITLITCIPKTNKQLVVVGKLVNAYEKN